MGSLAARLLLGVVAVSVAPACDFALIPQTAIGAGEPSTRIKVALRSAGADSVGDGIDGVRMTISDVLLRQVDTENNDEAWLVLNAETVVYDPLEAGLEEDLSKRSPVPVGDYDQLTITFELVEINKNGSWIPIENTSVVVAAEEPWFIDHGSQFVIDFDLFGSVVSQGSSTWTFAPNVSAFEF